jgi:hypothetical protein
MRGLLWGTRRANLSILLGMKSVQGSWKLEGSLHSIMWGLWELQILQINQPMNRRLQFSRFYIRGSRIGPSCVKIEII